MSFTQLLSQKDRDRLRVIVKRVHFKHYPQDRLTDYEADKFIDAQAGEMIERMLKSGVDSGLV